MWWEVNITAITITGHHHHFGQSMLSKVIYINGERRIDRSWLSWLRGPSCSCLIREYGKSWFVSSRRRDSWVSMSAIRDWLRLWWMYILICSECVLKTIMNACRNQQWMCIENHNECVSKFMMSGFRICTANCSIKYLNPWFVSTLDVVKCVYNKFESKAIMNVSKSVMSMYWKRGIQSTEMCSLSVTKTVIRIYTRNNDCYETCGGCVDSYDWLCIEIYNLLVTENIFFLIPCYSLPKS